jgi:hypothetical protein
MYNLDINFLNDREVAAEIAEQQPIEDKNLSSSVSVLA